MTDETPLEPRLEEAARDLIEIDGWDQMSDEELREKFNNKFTPDEWVIIKARAHKIAGILEEQTTNPQHRDDGS
jgi:hypothetical protein